MRMSRQVDGYQRLSEGAEDVTSPFWCCGRMPAHGVEEEALAGSGGQQPQNCTADSRTQAAKFHDVSEGARRKCS